MVGAMIAYVISFVLLVPLLYELLRYINHVMNLRNYPPGPFPLPIIGSLHLMGDNPHEIFGKMVKDYGKVFSISLGMDRVVVVNSIEPAREALITKGGTFAGRPTNMYNLSLITRGYKDIAFSEGGPIWKFLRKLGHSALKMYGDGIGNLETLVAMESEAMHLRLKEKAGQPVNMQNELGLTVLNVISNMLFGNRYHRVDDPEFQQVIKMNQLFAAGLNVVDAVAFIPWLRFFIKQPGLSQIHEAINIRDPLFRRKILEHKRTYDAENIRDFTDSLIKSSNEETWENIGVTDGIEDYLEMILSDMYFAGSETTVATLLWCIIYLLHWPHYQDEVYQEIIDVVGKGRYPVIKDRPQLPRLQAIIQESARLASIVPVFIRKATENSTIDGHNIPKGTQVYMNLWNLHHDEAEWENPNQFNPHRWLDEEQRYVPGKHRSYLPFGSGRRVCLGESVAKVELFVIFSRMIKDFKIELNMDEPFPSKQGRFGLTLSPYPFTVLLTPRDK